MKIEMEFQGLQELMKAFEDAASDEDIRAVNKKIVEQGEPVVKRIMSGKIPKSADIKLSGRGFGSKSSVTSHAADSVPLGAVKVKDTGASANVGWEKSDNSEHFYVKFINWGTIYLACGNQTCSVFLFFFIRHVSHLLSIAGRIHRPAALLPVDNLCDLAFDDCILVNCLYIETVTNLETCHVLIP